MEGFKKIASTEAIPPGEMKSFMIGFDKILICNIDGTFYALADECSHDSAPISAGHIDGGEIVCPRHGARFEAKSGKVTAPPALVPIDTFEIKIDGTDILLKLES